MHLYEKEVMKSYGYFPIKLAFLNSYADVSDSNALKYVVDFKDVRLITY